MKEPLFNEVKVVDRLKGEKEPLFNEVKVVDRLKGEKEPLLNEVRMSTNEDALKEIERRMWEWKINNPQIKSYEVVSIKCGSIEGNHSVSYICRIRLFMNGNPIIQQLYKAINYEYYVTKDIDMTINTIHF